MTLFCLFSFFILWLNMNESLQQDAQHCPLIHVDNNIQVIGNLERANSGTAVRFRCKSSSEVLEGSTEMYCDDNGQWSGIIPRCTEIKCGVPLIENGLVSGGVQEYQENQVLNYLCDPEYKRAEERPSKCMKVGTKAEWSPTPRCERLNCVLKLPPLEGTRYEPASRSVFLPGDTLRVFCGEEHWIVNSLTRSAETTCQNDGTWSIRPVCQEVICNIQRPPHVSTWRVYTHSLKKLGVSVYYTCFGGYRITSRNSYATCTRDGWGPKPLCRGTQCTKLNIENADITNPRDLYSNGERVQYICRNGNRNTFIITCEEGDWTGIKSCSVYCDKLNNEKQSMNFTSDKDKYLNGEVIEYQCNIPDPVAEGSATCKDGEWTKTVECKDITCKVGARHPGLTVAVQVGEKLQFDCSSELQLDGSREIECLPTGQWSAPIPTCL